MAFQEVAEALLESTMWTPTARRRYRRTGLRYASDLTDAEWALIEPLLPAACGRGRPRSWPLREPDGGDHRQPVGQDHRESGGPRGYDAGQKVKGRKRQALVDTDGRALLVRAHAADIQDRDGAVPLLRASRGLFPWIEAVFAGAGYAADRVATATRIGVEIVRTHPDQGGCAVPPRRWVVERFFAWLGRNRMNRGCGPRFIAKAVEATIASATAFLYAASVMLLIRRVARAA
jgi:transposase